MDIMKIVFFFNYITGFKYFFKINNLDCLFVLNHLLVDKLYLLVFLTTGFCFFPFSGF